MRLQQSLQGELAAQTYRMMVEHVPVSAGLGPQSDKSRTAREEAVQVKASMQNLMPSRHNLKGEAYLSGIPLAMAV